MNLLKRLKSNPDQEVPAKPDERRISRFRREIDKAFDRAWRSMQRDPWGALRDLAPWPPVDVEEDDHAITLSVDLPGLDAEDIEVQVSGNQLAVRGARKEERKSREAGVRRHERFTGGFTRTLTLPSGVDAAKIQAHQENGVLRIVAPKVPGERPKRVPVQVG
jgi:HSP20 family protein